MKLDFLFNNFHFFENDKQGKLKINWKKFLITVFILFILIQTFLALVFAFLHIFPPTTVYEETMEINDTEFYFNFGNNNGKEANSHLANVYLNSKELNIHNMTLEPSDGKDNYNYYMDIPKNVSHFKLDFYLEAEFPYISQHIIFDVERKNI